MTATGIPAASLINDFVIPNLPSSVGFLHVASPPSSALILAPSTLCKVQSRPSKSSCSVSVTWPAERSFAHLCDTSGGGRTWLRGLEKVHKRYMSAAMPHYLGRIIRLLIGAGKPRYASVLAETRCFLFFLIETAVYWIAAFRRASKSRQEQNHRDLPAPCALPARSKLARGKSKFQHAVRYFAYPKEFALFSTGYFLDRL